MSPFLNSYDTAQEAAFIKEAKEGSKTALEKLVKLHQRFIYNIALRLVHNPDDAADLTQEVLIKMVTKLGQFKEKSNFRTWLYRITSNHFLSAKRKHQGSELLSFEEMGEYLDTAYAAEDMTEKDQRKYSHLIDNTRNNCITGMLLCLDKQQRLVFILGAIFNLKSTVAAPLLGITPENFRKQLSRTRADLFQFMDNKCGLINPDNPCRCYKKTMGFIKEGKVEPADMKFPAKTVETVQSISPQLNDELDQMITGKYLALFKILPYEDHDSSEDLIRSLLLDKNIRNIFSIN